jgi:hypothetical protein
MFLNKPNLQDLELFTCKITSTALVTQERAFQLSPVILDIQEPGLPNCSSIAYNFQRLRLCLNLSITVGI